MISELTNERKSDFLPQGAVVVIPEDLPEDVEKPSAAVTPAEAFSQSDPPVPFQNCDFQPPAPGVLDAPSILRMLDFSWREPLERQVAEWLRVFIEEDQVVELRALEVGKGNGFKCNWAGFYRGKVLEQMAAEALELTGDAAGVYFTLNPLDQNLLARCCNRVEQAKETSADRDVLKRRWVLIEADPVRKAGISATDVERREAWETMRRVYRWLQERGCAEPVVADSGNGFHLLYRIDLPSDDQGLVKAVLEALAQRFDNAKVQIDRKVFNPGRIGKLYGTVARKGDSLQERPHRRTAVLARPPKLEVVSREQLKALAGEVTVATPKAPPNLQTVRLQGSTGEIVDRARKYLGKVPPATSGQSGHNQTFKVACILTQQFGLTKEEALPLFQEWNQTCQPPWSEKDLLHKLNDAADSEPLRRIPSRFQTDERESPGAGKELPLLGANEAVDDPHRLAQLFLDESRAAGSGITIRNWNSDWYRWDGAAYRPVPEPDIRAGLTQAIKAEFDRINQVERMDLATEGQVRERNARKVTKTLVSNALQALQSKW
jgi:hypothetical protein